MRQSPSSSTAHAGPACKRCRTKRIRCDSMPGSCENCARAGAPCLMIDSATKREYERSYVDKLREEINYYEENLRQRTSEPHDQHMEGMEVPVLDPPVMSNPYSIPSVSVDESIQSLPKAPIQIGDPKFPSYHGAGSVATIVHLVAAAVASKTRVTSFNDFGNEVAQEQSKLDRDHAKEASLPSPAVAQKLLDAYLNGPHVLHPFLQRSEITQIFQELSTEPSLAVKSRFRFYMICATGALYVNRTEIYTTSAIDYYMAAMSCEDQALRAEGLELAENILLLTVFSSQYEIGIGNKWELTRLAIRICIENGLHRKPRSELPLMEQQMRKRAFWVAYVNERYASSRLGRPLAIQDADITTPLPIDADDDLIEAGQPNLQQGRGGSEVTVQIRQIKIRQITARIHMASIRPRSGEDTSETEFSTILEDLNKWRYSAVTTENTNCTYYTRQWLDLNFFKEALSCYKAMVITSRGGNSQLGTVDAVLRCAECAIQIPQCYESLPSSKGRIMNWTCVQDLLSSGYAIMYSLHVVHEICNSSSIEPGHFGTVVGDDLLQQAFNSLGKCSKLLSHISGQWKSIQSHLKLFDMLTNATRQIVSPSQHPLDATQIASEDTTALNPRALGDREMDNNLLAGLNLPDLDFHMEGIDFDQLDWEQILSVPLADPLLTG